MKGERSAQWEQALLLHYQLATIDGLGLQELPLALRATGGLLAYLRDTQPLEEASRVPLERPHIVHSGDALVLDAQTRRNLELTTTQRDGQFQGSLLWAVDRSLTAMGGRSLRRWIEAPLMQRAAIEARQQLIGRLVEQRRQRQAIRRLLRPMGDLERLAGRAGAGHAGARDLVAIAAALVGCCIARVRVVGKWNLAEPTCVASCRTCKYSEFFSRFILFLQSLVSILTFHLIVGSFGLLPKLTLV